MKGLAEGSAEASSNLPGTLGNVKFPLPADPLLPDSLFNSPAAQVWYTFFELVGPCVKVHVTPCIMPVRVNTLTGASCAPAQLCQMLQCNVAELLTCRRPYMAVLTVLPVHGQAAEADTGFTLRRRSGAKGRCVNSNLCLALLTFLQGKQSCRAVNSCAAFLCVELKAVSSLISEQPLYTHAGEEGDGGEHKIICCVGKDSGVHIGYPEQ